MIPVLSKIENIRRAIKLLVHQSEFRYLIAMSRSANELSHENDTLV